MSDSRGDVASKNRTANERPVSSGDQHRSQRPAVGEDSAEIQIYGRIHRAISDRRLTPGARLVEEQLCEAFGASRARIRSVLQALARDKVVTLHRNRGASVSKPSVKEAREVFAARRVIESSLVRDVVRSIDAKGLERLKAHIVKEEQAEKSQDRTMELRTSHDFHNLLADTLDNSVLSGFVRELMLRSALVTAVYERLDANVCSHISHSTLINLIEKGDPDELSAAMLAHLKEIESQLVLQEQRAGPADLKTIFERGDEAEDA